MAAKQEGKKVTIRIPRGAEGEDNYITASLNGKVYKIKRGVDVEVPEGIAEIIRNSEAAKDEARDYIEGAAQ